MRQIFLDTETTGLSAQKGHRIIEIGAVEIIDRKLTGNDYQTYLNPERKIDPGSINVHGITNEFVSDKPLFKDIMDDLLHYISDSEIIMHNAPFDSSFLDNEFLIAGMKQQLGDLCSIQDSLVIAREMHPGKRNSLDALCTRYEVDTSSRDLHGALIDAKLLAHVYLLMTGGQVGFFSEKQAADDHQEDALTDFDYSKRTIIKLKINQDDLKHHKSYLDKLSKNSDKKVDW